MSRRWWHLFSCLMFALVISGALRAQDAVLPSSGLLDDKEVLVQASLDTVRMYIGDVATYTISAKHPAGVDVDTALAGPALSRTGFEIRDFSDLTTRNTDVGFSSARSFTFSTFTTGTYVIPPVPVDVKRDGRVVLQLASMPLTIEVVPVPRRPGERDDVRAIKAPMGIDAPALWPWVASGLGLLLLVLYFVLWVRNRGALIEETTFSPISAYEDALQRLSELRVRRDEGRIDTKEYHYGLGEVVRIYLERRFALISLSETTGELIESLLANDFDESTRLVVQDILEGCDMVKFARYEPLPKEIVGRDASVDSFLFATKPAPVEIVGDDEELVAVADDDAEVGQ